MAEGEERKRTDSEGEEAWLSSLLADPHTGLPPPEPEGQVLRCSLAAGRCLYFHYGCDGRDDRGWGCGYRTLQTLSSWLWLRGQSATARPAPRPPSLPAIQRCLVRLGDRPASLLGSRDWIGCVEAALVLDELFSVPCRLLHLPPSPSLSALPAQLHQHFRTQGSPAMMGGDRDASSKGVLGVCCCLGGASYLLIADPHYHGPPPQDRLRLQEEGWVGWRRLDSLDPQSFYNLCLPQTGGWG